MSRFFTGSDSESESSSSEEEQVQRAPGTRAAFAFSEDEEDTGRRVVRSAKDKRFEELQDIIKKLKNHKKIKDMSQCCSDFESLCKAYDKSKKVVDKEGIPRFYIKNLVELEDFVSECWEDREGRKAMSKNNSKGLTALRQKLRKYLKDFESELTAYRDNPDLAGEGEEGSGHEESDVDFDDIDGDPSASSLRKSLSPIAAGPDPSKFLKGGDDDDDDSDSDYWRSDSESDYTSSDDDETGDLRLKFLKKAPSAGGEDKKKKDDKKEKKDTQRKRAKKEDVIMEDEEDEEGWEKVPGGLGSQKVKQRLFPKDAEITHELVAKKLNEIVAARGKKGTDRNIMIDQLIELRSISATNNLGPAMDCKMLFSIIAAIYDYNPNIATCMKGDIWEKCLNYLDELVEQLVEYPDIIVGANVSDDSESFTPPYRVHGSLLSQIERMDEEFTKMLQACDAHSTEYVDRLKDEPKVYKLIEKYQDYFVGRATTEEICRIYMKIIEHVYYKFDPDTAKYKNPEDPAKENPREVMNKACTYLYSKDMSDRLRTRAILCHTYHQALHDRWFEARDLMLMSHLQDTIQHSDIQTQILYNRAMVQLGLCAFRQGMVKDAHNCLVDVQSTGRAKELLAQGLLLQRQHERTAEQEKIEKRRQMPYHKHINLELLECVYLVSAMLMEIPYMAAHEFDARRRLISKNFHHVMRVSDRQTLVGPPESMREHVVAASKAMKTGDWRACKNFIINEKMDAKVWQLFNEADKVRNMLVQKIQEESLRTYLFTYSQVYDSLSLVTLADMFELEKPVVHSIISKMIINEELMASMDEPTQSVMMHRTEPSRLQSLALQLSEKVANLSDNNEKIMEMKQGGGFFPYQKQGQQGGFQQQGKEKNFGQQGGYRDRNRDRNNEYGNQGGYRDRNRNTEYGNQGGYRDRNRNTEYGNQGGYRDRNRNNEYGDRGGYRNKDDYGRRQGGSRQKSSGPKPITSF